MPTIGKREVSRQGFGAMGLSHVYGQADDASSIATLHRAIDLGITFFDTATGYGPGHNEELLGKAIKGRRDGLVIASKFVPRPNGGGASVPAVKARDAVEASLTRLGLDHIDLYYLHRVDPDIPIEESIGELGRLVEEGKIGGVGVSEASAAGVRRAHATYPLTALQSEYSLWTRDVEVEILPTVRELGIGFVAYSPLGRGFLAGAEISDPDDRRRHHPRFQPDAVAANSLRRATIEQVAKRVGATVAQVSLPGCCPRAWCRSPARVTSTISNPTGRPIISSSIQNRSWRSRRLSRAARPPVPATRPKRSSSFHPNPSPPENQSKEPIHERRHRASPRDQSQPLRL